MKEVSCPELKKMLDTKEDFQLIDVREEYEKEIADIGGELIPMGDVMNNLDKISHDKKVVIYCRSGNRSGVITNALEAQGFKNIFNLKGGILGWANEIDPSITKY
jgi:adenylyltransferase/sulfurtransferase